jgi:glycerophosphoryl diester phosphodiesterase
VICYSRLEEKVVREVERFGWADRVVLSTFNHYSLRGMAQFRPNWSLAALYEYGLFAPWNYAKSLGVSAIHPFHIVATPEVIAGCKRHGIAVRPYTVDEPCEMERLIEAGAEAIITNVPDRLRRLFLSGECS